LLIISHGSAVQAPVMHYDVTWSKQMETYFADFLAPFYGKNPAQFLAQHSTRLQ